MYSKRPNIDSISSSGHVAMGPVLRGMPGKPRFMASNKTMLCLPALMALTLYAATGWAQSLARFSAEAGAGNYVDVAGIGVGTADSFQRTLGENWWWSVFWLGRAAYWRGNGSENRE